MDDNDPDKPLEDRHKQKLDKNKYVANQNGFQFVLAIFSHMGQIHGEIKRFTKEQMNKYVNN